MRTVLSVAALATLIQLVGGSSDAFGDDLVAECQALVNQNRAYLQTLPSYQQSQQVPYSTYPQYLGGGHSYTNHMYDQTRQVIRQSQTLLRNVNATARRHQEEAESRGYRDYNEMLQQENPGLYDALHDSNRAFINADAWSSHLRMGGHALEIQHNNDR